jgi:hypothetical protein
MRLATFSSFKSRCAIISSIVCVFSAISACNILIKCSKKAFTFACSCSDHAPLPPLKGLRQTELPTSSVQKGAKFAAAANRSNRKSSSHNASSARLLSESIENISRAAPY